MYLNGFIVRWHNPYVIFYKIPVPNKGKLQQIRKYDKDKIHRSKNSWTSIGAAIYNDKDHAAYCFKDLLPKTKNRHYATEGRIHAW